MNAPATQRPAIPRESRRRAQTAPRASGETRRAGRAGSEGTSLSEDQELLEAFREGAAPVLTLIYNRYAPIVAAFLARGFTFQSRGRTAWFKGYKEPYDLENCLQETFVRAFSDPARRSYNGVTSYLNYLLAIARNIVIDESRRRDPMQDSRRLELSDPLLTRELDRSSSTETPEHSLLRGELLALWKKFQDTLPDRERRYTEARFVQGQVRQAAADVCGLSLMQARTLERRIQRRFLGFMRDHTYLEDYQPGRRDLLPRHLPRTA